MKRLVSIFSLFTACIILSLSTPAHAQDRGNALPFLRVEGNHFVNEEGQPVMLRGMSFSDPDRLEKAGHWNKAYFQEAADWGANLVRFPVHPRAWRERGHDQYLKLLDQGIKWAGDLGLYVIIDWHSIGNLRTGLYQDPIYNTTKVETFRFWRIIAQRYKNNPVVAFYELFNEPTSYRGQLGRLTWAQHKAIMEDLIDVIYATDRKVIPMVGGLNWAYDLSPVEYNPIDREGIAYVTHPYPQKREQPWEPKWQIDFGSIADTYPVVATELGFMSKDMRGAHNPVIADETYGNAIIDFFEKRGISWTAWVFDPVWAPQLIDNWDFEPTMQGKFFRKKMQELNGKGQ